MKITSLNYKFVLQDSTIAHNCVENDANIVNYIKSLCPSNDSIRTKLDITQTNQGGCSLDICDQLNAMWNSYADQYFNIMSQILKLEYDANIAQEATCCLYPEPNDMINIKTKCIALNYGRSVNETFKCFIILLTKVLIIDKWHRARYNKIHDDFENANKIKLLAEIAVDAIFYNTQLRKACLAPTYKYFYSLAINNVNFMERFRQLYQLISIEDFLDQVYIFVNQNYSKLLQFKDCV